MERYKLNAVLRSGKGRQVRREKQVPAVLYGPKMEAIQLALPQVDISHFVAHGSANSLVDLAVGQQTYTVMLKDIQRNKIRGDVQHIDFYAVDLEHKLTASVPIHLHGEPAGIKAGGVLQHQAREIEVRCLPAEIPQGFSLDISAMNIGDSRTVADLSVTGNIEILAPETEVIVSILAPRHAEETETTDTGETPQGESDSE